MKNSRTPNRRAFVALLPATLLLAVPGLAQDIPTTTTPPPPVQTVAPPPVVSTVPPAAAATTPPVTPGVTAVDETPAPAAPARAARSARATPPARHAARAPAPAAAAPAPVVASPAPAPAPIPAEVTPVPAAPAPVTAAAAAPAIAPPATETTNIGDRQALIWPWLLGALVVIGAIALLMRRRRTVAEKYYEEPEEPYVAATRVEAEPIRAPIAAGAPAFAPSEMPQFLRPVPLAAASDASPPLASEDAALAEPEADEVAGLTAGDAPIADRPWLEFALRPVRAGTSADEALVEIELTVGNSGSVKAKDVRISTFMFAAEPGSDAEMDRLLIERGSDGAPPVTIEPGEGTRLDATLALSRAELIETTNGSILPVVVADARYTLADGTEGRTSASFTIGVSEEGQPAMSPISLTERAMHDEVEARLHGVPEHA